MEQIIELLERKNRFLEKFYLISEVELINFESGSFDNLESFYECRDKILNIVKHIEGQIESINQQYAESNKVLAGGKDKVERLLSKKDSLIGKITDVDLKVISCVDQEKSQIIEELRSVGRARTAVSGYRSGSGSRSVERSRDGRQLNEEV